MKYVEHADPRPEPISIAAVGKSTDRSQLQNLLTFSKAAVREKSRPPSGWKKALFEPA